MSGELILSGQQESKAVTTQSQQQPMRLIELAINANADIDKLERLMAMQQQWDERNAKREFLSAMARFQAECPEILKMKKGHNYLYAPLSDIIAQTRKLISDCGLSYRFEQDHEKGILVTCIVSHESGHSESNSMVAAPDTSGSKNAIQAIGSTVQYLMRYTFIGAFGITTADADMDGRLPQKAEVIDRAFELNRLRNSITNQGCTDVEFFGWFSKARKLQVVISSFDEINDEALQWAANKLEAQK